jgi:hypothetical protein
MDDYQRFIHASRYARWRDDLGRRETWEETVDRLIEYYANTYWLVEMFPENWENCIKLF